MSAEFSKILGPAMSLAKDLGLMEKIVLLITPQHQVAAAKLAEVMQELEKNYQAIEGELQRFADLSFPLTESPEERTKKLQALRPEAVQLRMEEARGSCHKIANIYDTYLAAKLRDLLIEEEDRIRVKNLFYEMKDTDGQMIATISQMAALFEEQIQKLEPLIKQGELHAASQLIKEKTQQMQESRHKIEAALVLIQSLRAKYIAASGAT
jgi:hypothetical protein